MKKILFVYNKFENYFNYFIKEAKNLQTQLDLVHYHQISIDFTSETKIYADSIELEKYDVVYFRNAWKNLELATLIAAYCQTKKIPVIDPVFTADKPWIDRKSFEYLTLKNANLPIIPSVFIAERTIDDAEKIGYPAVVKYTDASQGQGVFLVENKEQLQELFAKSDRTHLLVQQFIKNNGDYRLFVINNQVVASIKRITQSETEFRNNVSLGGKTEVYIPTDKEEKIAIEATKALNYSFAGVDLIEDENGELKIIEVNRSPQFLGVMTATRVNIPRLMIEYLRSIKK